MQNPFEIIDARLSNIEALLIDRLNNSVLAPFPLTTDDDTPLSVQQAAELLGIATQTVYQRIGQIPHTKRFGRLYFNRRELIQYINAGKEGGNS